MSSDSDTGFNSAQHIRELAEKARSNIIPPKSKKLYEKQYEKFQEWRVKMKTKNTDQDTILAYFENLVQNLKYKASTLWSVYTKLKSMLNFKERVDIGKYVELQAFLKRKKKEHKEKKSAVFTDQQVAEFLNNAPDDEFLLHKVSGILNLV